MEYKKNADGNDNNMRNKNDSESMYAANNANENNCAAKGISISEQIKLCGGCHIMNIPCKPGFILLCGVYGEIEGHEKLPSGVKSTSYEEILPVIAQAEVCPDIRGVLVLINTVGGDVESGLAISEMFASLSKPVVTLVLGGGHSIGVPLATASDVSFIAPTATMVVHPIRISSAVLGVKQNFEYIEKMQQRIIDFTVSHSEVDRNEFEGYMFNTKELAKDIGSVLVGKQAVEAGIIDEVGGMADAIKRLYDLIN